MTVEVPAPASGAIESISVKAGDTVQVGAILGAIAEGKAGTPSAVAASNPDSAAPKAAPAPTPAAAPKPPTAAPAPKADAPAMPSVRRIAEESGVDPARVAGTGKDGARDQGRYAGRGSKPAPLRAT